MIGTLAISGSPATRFKNFVIVLSESSSPSSMLMSMICAPASTCCRAILSAPSKSPSRIALENLGLPVILLRSPTLTKFVSGRITNGSRPEKAGERRRAKGRSRSWLDLLPLPFAFCPLPIARGAIPLTASAIALMCAGVLPQQPPTMFSSPARAKSAMTLAMYSGVSSYSPKAFGSPALG